MCKSVKRKKLKNSVLSQVQMKNTILAAIKSLKYIVDNTWKIEDVEDIACDIKEIFEPIYISIFVNLDGFDIWYEENIYDFATKFLRKKATDYHKKYRRIETDEYQLP